MVEREQNPELLNRNGSFMCFVYFCDGNILVGVTKQEVEGWYRVDQSCILETISVTES